MPADPEFLRLARVAAKGLASRLSFTIDEIDDLGIGIDELLFAVMGSRGRSGTVHLEYAISGDGLQVVGMAKFDDEVTPPGLSEWSELILAAVADEHTFFVDNRSHGFRLVKRRGGTGT